MNRPMLKPYKTNKQLIAIKWLAIALFVVAVLTRNLDWLYGLGPLMIWGVISVVLRKFPVSGIVSSGECGFCLEDEGYEVDWSWLDDSPFEPVEHEDMMTDPTYASYSENTCNTDDG